MITIVTYLMNLMKRNGSYQQLTPAERASLRTIDHVILAGLGGALVYAIKVYGLGQPVDTTTITETGLVMAALSGAYKYVTARSDPKLIDDEPPAADAEVPASQTPPPIMPGNEWKTIRPTGSQPPGAK